MNSTHTTTGELSGRNYAFLQSFLMKESGIVVDDDKRYLIESRLRPIVLRENIASMEACATWSRLAAHLHSPSKSSMP